MLNAVHKQLLAARLADMFAASPLMLVYQTLGTVRSSQISESLQSELEKRVPNSGVKATCFKIKNSVSVGVEDATLQGLLQANNILVGWQVPQDSILSQLHASRNTRLSELLAISAPSSSSTSSLQSAGQASTSAAAGARPSSIKAMRPHLPQSTMSVLIELSTKMPDKMPVALLASFYRGQQVKVKHLKDWMALNEATVYHELLGQLDGASVGPLLELESAHEALAGTMDSLPHNELAMLLEAAQASQGGAASAGGPAAVQ